MKKELVVLVDYFTCQKNGVSFDDYVKRLASGFEGYESKVMRDPTSESTDGDYSRTWAVSRLLFEGTSEENKGMLETARQIFEELKNAAR